MKTYMTRITALMLATVGLTLGACSTSNQASNDKSESPQSSTIESTANDVDSDTTTVYIVRHARTEANEASLISGWSDTSLTPEGEEQARAAGKVLADVQFDAVLSSSLGRAIHTTELILEENTLGGSITPIDDLREQSYGKFEEKKDPEMWVPLMEKFGYTYDSSKDIDGVFWNNEDAIEFYSNTSEIDIMNGLAELDDTGQAENWNEYETRLQEAIKAIADEASKHPGGNILVVSHGGAIATILRLMDESGYDGESIGNASISTVIYDNGKFAIKEVAKSPTP